MKYWETIADNLSKAGWSWGVIRRMDSEGRDIVVVDAHRDGKRYVVRADEKEIPRDFAKKSCDLTASLL